MRTVAPLLAALVLMASTLRAAVVPPPTPPPTSPAPAANALAPGSRILKNFDFEEKALGNYETIPMFWSKVAGHGYPAYSTGQFDTTVFRSATNSFKLQIDGGSAAFQYMPGKIVINPGADYYVLAFVKTTPLDHAKAQISAWFADGKGKILGDTALHSAAYSFPATAGTEGAASIGDANHPAGDWHILHIYIPGPGADSPARSLVLQVGLLQPQQLAGRTASDLGKFALYQQDIKGAAWFDDIVVFQLPRLSVNVPANVTANIFAPGRKVELDLTVSDLPTAGAADTGKLSATLNITGPEGLLFAREKYAVSASDKQPWTQHYVRAALPAGLYTATLDVSDAAAGTLIARRQTRFVCLAAPFAALETPDPEFGFTLPGGAASTDLWADLPAILRQTRAGIVQVPAWREDMSEDALLRRDPPFDSLLTMLQRNQVRALANFSDVPAALAQRIAAARKIVKAPVGDLNPPPADSILALYSADADAWRPYVSFLLARYANRIDGWEFGSVATPYSGTLADASDAAAYSGPDPRYAQLYAKTTAELSGLLHDPHLIVPWNALVEFDPKAYPGARLDLRLPAAIKPSQIPTYIDNFRQALAPVSATQPATQPGMQPAARPIDGGDATIYAHLVPLDEGLYGRSERLADFAQRVVYARTAAPAAIFVDLPMSRDFAKGSFASRPEPDELLVVYRTLIEAMGNRRYVREIPLAPGIKAFLFEGAGVGDPGGGEGTLIAWNDSGAAATVHLDLALGLAPREIDLAGNCRNVAVDAGTNTSGVDITATPVIFDRVDSKALQLRASFGLATTVFPAGAGLVRTEVLLTNPYNDALTGNLKVILPRGWSMDPSLLNISLAAGASMRRSVTIRYPYSEMAGVKTIEGRLTTDDNRRFEFSCNVAVSSDMVQLDSFSQLLPNGDLVIQEVITNISHVPLNAQAFAQVPGYPRQQRYLLGLEAGRSTIKRFVFKKSMFVDGTKGAGGGETTAGDIAKALSGKTAGVGLRENDGRSLITKGLRLE